jgi:hypothetical protein
MAVGAGVTALVVAGMGLTACSSDEEREADYVAVCEDETGTRVPDEQCDDDDRVSGGPHWYFIPVGLIAPAIGGRLTGGTRVAPNPGAYTVRRGGVDPAGGVVRGGFGGRDGSVGG